MYNNGQLGNIGELGLPTGASSLISSGVSAGVNYAVASATAGALLPLTIGSMAGPIGAIVGAIVSLMMALFGGGGPTKKPWFGLYAVKPKNGPITVGELLSNAYGLWDPHTGQGWPTVQGKAGIAISSGGLKEAHKSATGAFGNIQAKQAELMNMIVAEIQKLPKDLQIVVLNTPMNLGKEHPADIKGAFAAKLDYDPYILAVGKDITNVVTEGYNKLLVVIGDIIRGQAAVAAARPPEMSISNITQNLTNPSSPVMWLALAGGYLLLSR